MGTIAGVYQLDGSQIGSGLTAQLKQVAGTSFGPKLKYWSSGPVAFVGNNIIYRNRQSDISSAFTPSLVDDEIVMVETGFNDDPQSSIECANQIYTDFICTEKREAENIEISSSWVAWDHSNRILRCYRDQLGRIPLYYTHVANRYFVFASTMRTILFIIDKAIEPRLNRAHAIKFLLGRSSEAGQTFFQHINRLSAAHTIYVTGQGITTRRYWTPELHTTKQYTDKGYCDRFRELFVRSVAKACGNSHHIGVLLSGGIDSSLVTCVTADLVRKNKIGHLQSFTNLYGHDDERHYANLVVEQKKIDAHFLQTDDINIFNFVNEYTANTEEPFAHPGYLAIGKSFTVARQKGVKLLLDGSLGDSVISYNSRFIEEYLRKGSIFTGLREAVLFSRRMQGEHSSQLSFFWQRGVHTPVSLGVGERPITISAVGEPGARASQFSQGPKCVQRGGAQKGFELSSLVSDEIVPGSNKQRQYGRFGTALQTWYGKRYKF